LWPRRSVASIAVVAAVVLLGQGAVSSNATTANFPPGCSWLNTHQTADQRARLLLNASTLDQKLRWLDEQSANSPTQTTFSGVTYPVQVSCTPTVVYTDGPDYVRGSAGVTVFPAQIDLAASWNTDLAYAKGKAQGDEAFRSGKNVILGPGVSSSRTPLAGRTPEYLSEDPLLSGDLAAADINGIQTGNPNEPVMAVVKHFIANEQELDRMRSSSNIDGRTLREVYNQPFAIAIAKGSPGGVMCSYNQVNGAYACENPVLDNLLKGADGFNGYVMSDFGAVHSTGPSLTNGLDLELNRPVFYTPANINAAIDDGQVSPAEIDAAAFRVVRAYIKAGLFDHPLPTTPSTTASDPANRAVAADIAEQGSVLLRDTDHVLPLTSATKSVAVIGPTAANTPTGGISAGTVCAEGGATAVACPTPIAPLDAITARAAEAGATVSYASGADLTAAADTARKAGVAVVFAYAKQGEGADRTTLSLDDNGDALISAVAAANPNTVVVLETGTAVTMPWLSQVKGVIEAWYPGDQQGIALATLLYGDVDFSGRLPMTFPVSLADTPEQTPAQYPGTFANGSTTRPAGDTGIRQVTYSEGLAVGYKWYDSQGIDPLFPFGFGLSYTSFAYSQLRVSQARQQVTVSFDVTNTGSVAGTETPQVYVTLPAAAGEPGKRLVGFDRVTVRPGKTAHVQVTINPGTVDHPLSYWDTTTHAWETAPGSYGVSVGSSSRNLPLSGGFQVR
jgi:beta-glucosidase